MTQMHYSAPHPNWHLRGLSPMFMHSTDIRHLAMECGSKQPEQAYRCKAMSGENRYLV
jgi:hypothetical protein